MQDPLYTSSYTSACHHPLSSLQAISTMSSLSVHNVEQVDQHWTEEDRGYLPTVEKLDVMPGTSVIRDAILERIANMGLQRPPGNIERKRLELHELNLM